MNKIEMVVSDFLNEEYNKNGIEYAREYGVDQVIDGFLYYNYEGFFTDEEIEKIMEQIEENL